MFSIELQYHNVEHSVNNLWSKRSGKTGYKSRVNVLGNKALCMKSFHIMIFHQLSAITG